MNEGVVWLTIFILSVFVGIEVISKVSSTLHTPLMSGANAIHGVILLVNAMPYVSGADIPCAYTHINSTLVWHSSPITAISSTTATSTATTSTTTVASYTKNESASHLYDLYMYTYRVHHHRHHRDGRGDQNLRGRLHDDLRDDQRCHHLSR